MSFVPHCVGEGAPARNEWGRGDESPRDLYQRVQERVISDARERPPLPRKRGPLPPLRGGQSYSLVRATSLYVLRSTSRDNP
jgi:hypothetical protein